MDLCDEVRSFDGIKLPEKFLTSQEIVATEDLGVTLYFNRFYLHGSVRRCLLE